MCKLWTDFFQDILNHSDHQSILQLANLVEGAYTFVLTVTDNRGLVNSDSVVLSVKQGLFFTDTSLGLRKLIQLLNDE